MWHDLFAFQIPVLEKILRTILVYALIVLIFRFSGKRAIAMMNTMDFVVMFLLSNVVQNAIIGNDNSFLGGAVGAVTLVVVNALVDRLAYLSPTVRHLVEGRSSVVVHDGVVDQRVLRRLGLRRAELDHSVRVQNGNDLSEVWTGKLATSGHLVLSLRPEDQGATAGDVAALRDQLARIESLLTAAGAAERPAPGHAT